MKFNCGLTTLEKYDAKVKRDSAREEMLSNWHSFFAILPRQVASRDCRCMEEIERKGTAYSSRYGQYPFVSSVMVWKWEYRAKQ